jgi:hypothetical protein
LFCLRKTCAKLKAPLFRALCSFAPVLPISGNIYTSEVLIVSTAKDELTKLIESQPDDSSPEQIVRELAFHIMVQRGLADAHAGRTISNEEMQRRIRSWQE